MWASHPILIQSASPPFPLVLLRKLPPPPHIFPSPPLNSCPPHRRPTPSRNLTVSAGENRSGLGQTLITALNPTPEPKKKQDGEEDARQLSGSDVLWALQKAAATQKSKKPKKRVLSSAGSRREEEDVDYSHVKPLVIRSEWAAKLDELQKRLQELSEMV